MMELATKVGTFFRVILFLLLFVVSFINAFADYYDKATYYLVLLIFLIVVDGKVNP